jgi:hypothetical protein
MDTKRFEERLDEAMEKLNASISEATKRLEDSFEKARRDLENTMPTAQRYRELLRSEAMWVVLLVLGVLWLLYTLHFFDQVIFPIVLIVVSLFMMLRKGGSSS